MMENSGNISFKQFREKDMAGCARIVRKSWPFISKILDPAGQLQLVELIELYVELTAHASSWLEVARDAGESIGFLFALIKRDFTPLHFLYFLNNYQKFIITIKEEMLSKNEHARMFLKKFLESEQNVRQHAPKSDAVVELFAVDPHYRRRGVGTRLMDDFIEFARSRGVKRIMVYTDERSTYRFYEAAGFSLQAEFPDCFYKTLLGKPTRGFIYLLKLKKK